MLENEIQPLSSKLHKQLTDYGVKSFTLEFQGGSDNGELHVEIIRHKAAAAVNINATVEGVEMMTAEAISDAAEAIVHAWAWGVYSYSGAGDGSAYGDNVEYNLQDNTVTATEWYMQQVDGDVSEHKLEVSDDE